MDIRTRRELCAFAALVMVFVLALVPALFHARREARDGIRRAAMVQLKRELEGYYNKHERYPLTFDAKGYQYVVTKSDGTQAVSWYVRAELENRTDPVAVFDFEHNVYYRVVNDRGKTYYDVCGGTSRCGAAEARM